MKVILLDIDGVLNSGSLGEGYHRNPTQARHVEQLARVLAATGARIVWSTSWRTKPGVRQADLDGFLAERGLRVASVGVTPLLTTEHGWGLVGARERRHEVKAWLDAHPEVTGYATLDDDTEAALDPGRHVQCEDIEGGGLNAERADLAIRILNRAAP